MYLGLPGESGAAKLCDIQGLSGRTLRGITFYNYHTVIGVTLDGYFYFVNIHTGNSVLINQGPVNCRGALNRGIRNLTTEEISDGEIQNISGLGRLSLDDREEFSIQPNAGHPADIMYDLGFVDLEPIPLQKSG